MSTRTTASCRNIAHLLGLSLLAFVVSCNSAPVLPSPEGTPYVATQATVPSGFTDALVSNVPKPTALAFAPDGRLLIATQPGKLIVRQNGAQKTAYTMTNLCSDFERGLLGVAVDPQFSNNRFIYLYYTLNKFGSCGRPTSGAPVNQVARFTLSSTNTINASSRVVLIDNIPSPRGIHNGGDLHFGKDGNLYVSVGDSGTRGAARVKHTLVGKILRITKNGGIPSSNPFQGTNSVRCNASGRTTSGKVCREIYASGLRNPFRMAFDPNVSGTKFFINDVGEKTREEIDLGRAGADYGWDLREGRCVTGSSTNCGSPPAGLTNPVFDYAHATSGRFANCSSISGGAFVPNGFWPASFNNTYLFSDFACGRIFKLTPSSTGYAVSTFASGLGAYSAVHLTFGAFNGGRALYYTTYANGGQVRRISYGRP